MKMFLIMWGLFCFLVIAGLFIACTTAPLPGVPAAQSRSEDLDKSGQVELETPTDEDYFLSAEERKRLVKQAEAILAKKKQAEKKLEEMTRNLE